MYSPNVPLGRGNPVYWLHEELHHWLISVKFCVLKQCFNLCKTYFPRTGKWRAIIYTYYLQYIFQVTYYILRLIFLENVDAHMYICICLSCWGTAYIRFSKYVIRNAIQTCILLKLLLGICCKYCNSYK